MTNTYNPICDFCKSPTTYFPERFTQSVFTRFKCINCEKFGITIYYFLNKNKCAHYEIHSILNTNYYFVTANGKIDYITKDSNNTDYASEITDTDIIEIYNNLKLLCLYN